MLVLGFWSSEFEEAENIAGTVLLVFRNVFQFLRVIMLLKNQRKIRAESIDLDIPLKLSGIELDNSSCNSTRLDSHDEEFLDSPVKTTFEI